MEAFFLVGEVLRPQGIRGEAKVRPYAANPGDFLKWKTLYVKEKANGQDSYRPLKAACSRVHDGFAYITLEGCTSPDDVEKLRGAELYIDRDHAAPLDEGEYYVQDLIGCEAVDGEGHVLGVLEDVLQYGTVDTYVFRTPRGTLMAPALEKVFPETDVEGKKILVDMERLEEVAVFED